MLDKDIFSILPLLIAFITPILVMMFAIVRPKSNSTLLLAFLGVALALLAVPASLKSEPQFFGRFFITDEYAKICTAGLLASALVVILLSREWFISSSERVTEYSILLLISLVGALTLLMSNHFLSFFVSLELLSIPVYAMIAYQIKKRRSLEAGLKYILLAGFSVSILLFGIALLYKDFKTLDFETIFKVAQLAGPIWTPVGWVGFILFFMGIAFKIGLVPFHMWLPDVYEGAPMPVTAYLSTISKGAVLFFALRFIHNLGVENLQAVASMLAAFAVMSMFFGNIMALKQQNLKRLLAYSSIAQVGYMLIAVLSNGPHMVTATLVYVFGYFAAILCALGALAIHARFEEEKEMIKSLEGMFFSRPTLAIALTVSLLSFTGLPLTVGFIGKFYILFSGMDQWPLVLSLVLSSAIGFYAYFKVILSMATRGSSTIIPQSFKASVAELLVLSLAFMVVFLGVMPSVLTKFISQAKIY